MAGRTRALRDPFWATALPRMQPSSAEIVKELHKAIRRSPLLAPYCWMGSGWRTGSVEHSSGRAIDIMITGSTNRMPSPEELAAGNLLVDWLVENADALGVQGIIFSRDGKRRPQFWGYSKGRYWRNGAPRGSISGDHVDHVHVLFRSWAKWTLGNTTIGPRPVIVDPVTVTKGVLDMSKHESLAYRKPQTIKGGEHYLRAHPKGWWWLHQTAGLTAVSIHGYATAGNDSQIFICAEDDTKKTGRLLGRADLPNGRGSFTGSALATLREGEVLRLRVANNSGKDVVISNVTTNIVYEG